MTEEILIGIRDFLQLYLPLLNTHNLDYLNCDHWNTYVPEWIHQEERIDFYNLFEQRYREFIIDYGSGRGYLGVKISHDYDRYVLSIESCEITVYSSERRIKVLSKYQKELDDHIKYKSTSTIVNNEKDFEKLFYQTSHFYVSLFLLCSLHACGLLTSSLLYYFVENFSVRTIANVAYCYHLLEEKFI